MKMLYLPFRLLAGFLGHRVGNQAFGAIWEHVGDGEGPMSTNASERPLVAVAGGAALQAAVIAASVAVADQLAARLFHRLLGTWPGAKKDGAETGDAAVGDAGDRQP